MRALHAGTTIRNYEVLRVLGEAGFRITYLAKDEALEKLVVIDEFFPQESAIRADLIVEPGADRSDDFEWGKDRYKQEARFLARLSNLVLQIFEANNTVYVVHEYRPGRDLADWLKEISSPPTQIEFDSLLGSLLTELELIHQSDVLHLAISPHGIHICADGVSALIGVIVVKDEAGERARRLPVIEDAVYSAPELHSRDRRGCGPWSDIYSLAATLYHAIGGAAPDKGVDRLLADNLAPAKDVARLKYRASFLEAIDWALRLRPMDRPQTVAEWRSRLLG